MCYYKNIKGWRFQFFYLGNCKFPENQKKKGVRENSSI